MVAGTLDDCDGTRVTYTKALTHLTVNIEFAAGGSIETRVTGDDILFGLEVVAATGWGQNRNTSA